MSGYNLPPGVTTNLLPGNHPADEAFEHGYTEGVKAHKRGEERNAGAEDESPRGAGWRDGWDYAEGYRMGVAAYLAGELRDDDRDVPPDYSVDEWGSGFCDGYDDAREKEARKIVNNC